MEDHNSRDVKIFADMKKCVEEMGLKILDEKVDQGIFSGMSTFAYPDYNMAIVFNFDTSQDLAEVIVRYADMPEEKLSVLYELLNYMNNYLMFNHFSVDFESGGLFLRSGMIVNHYFLDKEVFKRILINALGTGYTFMPMIAEQINTEHTPQAIMERFVKSKESIPLDFPEHKESENKEKLPFYVHGSADMPAFPTHTHGLMEIGLPEFLMDHLAFGPMGNGGRIKASYYYFTRPENVSKLEAIRNGETVKLTGEELKPGGELDDIVYCYRKVYPEFEMVKQAYCLEDPKDIDPRMWFVQIYAEGDDFALTDDYYKGGIKW